MMNAFLFASLGSQWAILTQYLSTYMNRMDVHQWMIVSGAMVALGFLCLRGNPGRY